MKVLNCKYCKTDDVKIYKTANLWAAKCRGGFCLIVQSCETEKEVIKRWNDICDSSCSTRKTHIETVT